MADLNDVAGGKPWGGWRATASDAVRVFGFASLTERGAVLGLSVIYGVLDLVSLTMLVPLLAAAADMGGSNKNAVVALRTMFAQFQLPFEAPVILAAVLTGLALKALTGIVLQRLVDCVVERTNQLAQLDLIRGLLAVRWSWFVQQPVGRLAHAIGAEAASAGAAFRYLTDLITSGVQVLAFVLIAALLSWQFLVVLVVVALVATLALWPLTRRGRRTVRGDTRRLRRQAGLFVNTLSGVKAIRAMGRGQYFAAELESEIRERGGPPRPRLDGNAAVELREPAVGALLAIGFYLAVTRLALPLQDLVIMAILTVRALGSVLPMQRQMQRFVRNRHKLAGLTELQADCAAQREPTFGAVPPRLTKALQLEGVRFGFPGRDILRDLCIEVPAGRITTLTGRSGIGKSTIVDLVVGLQQPAAGRVTIDGVDLAEIDIAAWRLVTGYVPQEILLVHDSLLRNVTLGAPGLPPNSAMAALEAAGAAGFVAELPQGLASSVGERGAMLSGGQRQRIAIARALLLQPTLLILDEATSGLDPATEAEICHNVRELCRRRGLTVLAISHQPGWQRIADRVYRLEPGGSATLLKAGETVLP